MLGQLKKSVLGSVTTQPSSDGSRDIVLDEASRRPVLLRVFYELASVLVGQNNVIFTGYVVTLLKHSTVILFC